LNKDRAHLVCYNTTFLERNLALRLGIPLYGADPQHVSFGTKSGCRKLFARAGINHPVGADNLNSMEEVVSTLVRMRSQRPSMTTSESERKKCAARVCNYASHRWEKWNSSQLTIRCLAVRADNVISAASFPPILVTRARSRATRRKSETFCGMPA